MDTVRVFNQELSGLYESKPPISKAKMASITRSAMKAIKFYKHVVQSVEKFISKCKSEYKIPGLYVIDSIVRQSRHQFGTDKDVFAPRFARNMEQTFAHLFRCPPEDKSKIIRVLNLWQKNMVFAPETIQPLFDLANPDHPLHLQYNASLAAGGGGADQSGAGSNGAGGLNTSSMSHDSPGPMSHDDHHSSGGGGGGGGGGSGGGSQATDPSKVLDPNTIRQLQQFQQILMRQTSGSASETGKNQVKFDKKLLTADFDYGSEDEEDKNSPSVPSTTLPDGGNIAAILSDPNVLKQLQQLQNLQKLKQHEMEEKQSKLTEMRLQEEKFEKHLASVLKKLPFANECDLSRQPTIDMNAGLSSSKDGDGDDFGMVTEVISDTHSSSPRSLPPDNTYKSSSSSRRRKSRSRSRDRGGRDRDRDRDRGGRSRKSRSRSRSRSYSPRRGGGTSGSGRSGGRDRDRASQKDKERDKERERERKKRGLPEIRKEHLSVCSTTLWVGHLSKLVQQEELSDTFGKYGDIVSIDLIPPRGCAFIVMNRRQDAYKSMQSLKNHKMHGRTITISWATGKGVKSKEWKDYWDIDLGCSYIPWSKINHSTDLEALEEGGMFDEETMPQWLKDKIANKGAGVAVSAADPASAAGATGAAATGLIPYPLDTSQPPPPPSMMAAAGMASLAGFPLGARLPMMGLPLMAGLGMNVPPPNLMMPGAPGLPANPPPLPMGASGFGALPPPPPSNIVNLVSGDEMDIEMEDENSNSNPLQPPPDPAAFFNQPPPPLMPPDFNRNNPMAGQPGGDFNQILLGDNDRGGGGRGNRGNDFDRRGGRGDRGGRRDFDRDNGNSRDRGRRNFRDGSNDGDRNEPRQSRWGSNDRNRGSDGGRDDRPLSERLRELAGSDFSQRNDDDGSQQQQQGPPFGGGRNFRGGRNINNDGGDDFNDFGGGGGGGRRGNFQNQGGRFQNQRGGRFNNRGGGGGFNRQQQQQRGGPDGDMQGGPMNIMSLLNMFGGNEDMPGNMDGGGNMDPDMMQDQFFDGGNNNNFVNRRGNNWNNDRGNRGGRGGNWRDNNDGGDGSDGGGGGRGGRFGRRGDRGRRNDFGGFGGGDDQPPQRGRGGGGQGGPRWDENDETWDDQPSAKPRGNSRPPRDEPAQKQQRQQPREEPVRDSQESGILGGGDEWECDAPKRIAPNFSEPAPQQHEEPASGGGGGGGDSYEGESSKQQDRHEGGGGSGGAGNGTPLFDESVSAPAPAPAAIPELFRNASPPPKAHEPEPEPQPQKFPSPEPNRPQLYSPSPPPPQQQQQEVFEERNFAQEEPQQQQQQQYQPEPEQQFEPEPVRETAPEPQQHHADEAAAPPPAAVDAAAPEESGPPPADDA